MNESGGCSGEIAELFRDRRVLVTGGAGFIGSYLVRALVGSGATVTVYDNLQAGRWENLASVKGVVCCVEGDVRSSEGVRDVICSCRPEYVFHLAANASVPGSVSDPVYDFETNCLGTFVVLNAVRMCEQRPRIVLASSAAVYGEPERRPIVETSPLCPISPYGTSKLAAEECCRMFHAVYGMDVVIGRVFNTYGPEMPRFVVLDFLKKLRSDHSILEILGDGRQMRDFNYIDDTVAGLMLLASRGDPGTSYNIASGVSHTVTDVARIILQLRSLASQTELKFTGSSWQGDAQRWSVDVGRARSLGYVPQVSLQDGLARVVSWFDAADK